MENLLRLWRENLLVRIFVVGCVVLVSFLVIRNPWPEGVAFLAGAFQMAFEITTFVIPSFILILLVLCLFSGFVLPARGGAAWLRLVLFMFGGHGQAIWVKDGSVEDSARNADDWRYPSVPIPQGVLILDAASGAQLRTSNQFTRTVGPGVTFIRKREYLGSFLF